MQYILSEDEYNALINKAKEARAIEHKKLQQLCTDVANYKPIKFWGRKEAGVWGCILNDRDDETLINMGYCDECPVQKVCPNPDKDWSK